MKKPSTMAGLTHEYVARYGMTGQGCIDTFTDNTLIHRQRDRILAPIALVNRCRLPVDRRSRRNQ